MSVRSRDKNTSGVMCINIPDNKRYFVVAEEVGDGCVVISAATAIWRNVDVVDMQLLAIGIVIEMLFCSR